MLKNKFLLTKISCTPILIHSFNFLINENSCCQIELLSCLKLCNISLIDLNLSGFRPPDRRRRDLFGVANVTSIHTLLAGHWNLTEGNFSDDEPPRREFSFLERKVKERHIEITGLQPFTVYRIDLHACNEEVRHCSAAAFVFSRTKAAGKSGTTKLK